MGRRRTLKGKKAGRAKAHSGSTRRSPPPVGDNRDPRALKVHPENERLVPRMSEEKRAAFVAAVRRDGRIHDPLEILPDGTVLCGRERCEVAIEVGLERVPVLVRADLVNNPDGQILRIVLDNLERKDFTEPQKVKQLKAIEPLLQKQAHQRKARTQFGRGRAGPGKFAGTAGAACEEIAGEVRVQMAKLAGLSARSWNKASALFGVAEHAPIAKLYEHGYLSIDAAHRALKLDRETQERLVTDVLTKPEDGRAPAARQLVGRALKLDPRDSDASDGGSSGGAGPVPAEVSSEEQPEPLAVERVAVAVGEGEATSSGEHAAGDDSDDSAHGLDHEADNNERSGGGGRNDAPGEKEIGGGGESSSKQRPDSAAPLKDRARRVTTQLEGMIHDLIALKRGCDRVNSGEGTQIHKALAATAWHITALALACGVDPELVLPDKVVCQKCGASGMSFEYYK